MNQHASDGPQHDRDESPDEVVDLGATQDDPDEPIAAQWVSADDAQSIRVGSPFVIDPIAAEPSRPIEVLLDVGPIRYTAMGAVAASIMVLGFAAAATWWFPAGGTLIAALGCALSIFGLYSNYRITSAGLLAIHLCLFVLCYGRSLS
jgi:hypothetical protein